METLHPDDVNAILPDDVRTEEEVRDEMQRLVSEGKKIDSEPPDASPHCLLRLGRGRDGSCFAGVHRDPCQGSGATILDALVDLQYKIEELLPKLEKSTDSFSRLVRTSILREVLRTFSPSAF